MTIAERMRTERENSVNFDAVLFMEEIEKRFNEIPYEAYIEVDIDDCYKTHPRLCNGNLHFNWHKDPNYQCLDSVGVPAECFHKAIELLRKENFCLYRVDERRVKVSLMSKSYISYGIYTYYPIN